MIPLPIAYREMLVTARSRTLYRGRVILSLMVLLAGMALAALHQFAGVPPMALSMTILPMLGFFLGIYCLFAGMQATADSISGEKREGTLGLLYLTHMRTGQILFGKLIAHTLAVFYGLLTAFPLISLLLLLGGVNGTGMLKLFLGALNLLFFSASIGLFFSSVGVDRKRTVGSATWVILLFWFVPGMVAQILFMNQAAPRWVWQVLLAISPTSAFDSLSPFAAPISVPYIWSVGAIHALGWLFLFGAAYNLPRRWQEKAAPAGRRTWKERWQQFSYGAGHDRLHRRNHFLGQNPILWLTARNRLRPWTSSVLFLFLLSLFAVVYWNIGLKPQESLEFVVVVTIILMQVQKLRLGVAATSRLNEEHEQGTLELLLSTPLSVRDFIRGETRALLWQLRFPFLLILVLQVLVCGWFIWEAGPSWDAENLQVAIFGSIFMFLHYLDLWTATSYGMWACVTIKQPKRAAQQTIGIVVFLPVVAFGLSLALMGLLTWLLQPPSFPIEPWHFPAWYAFLVLVNDLFWLTLFRRRFAVRLREFASKRFVQEETPSLADRLFDMLKWRRKAAEPPLLRA